eukprot:6771338-Ditylum_brightwellii.AAC.1
MEHQPTRQGENVLAVEDTRTMILTRIISGLTALAAILPTSGLQQKPTCWNTSTSGTAPAGKLVFTEIEGWDPTPKALEPGRHPH